MCTKGTLTSPLYSDFIILFLEDNKIQLLSVQIVIFFPYSSYLSLHIKWKTKKVKAIQEILSSMEEM